MAKYMCTSNVDLASAFIVSTCQVFPNSFSAVTDYMRDIIGSQCPSQVEYRIACGSFAEFYIRPLNACIDDIDFLNAKVNELAFIGDFPALPSDRRGLVEWIKCYKIESYKGYLGFVRLQDFGELKYNWKHNKYEYKHTANKLTPRYRVPYYNMFSTGCQCLRPQTVSGPACKHHPVEGVTRFGMDDVESVWYPEWPEEAKDWPFRARRYGWPTIATISEVVQNGCHVVHAQHRDCRGDDLQWRLSFSIAEIVLLQSWTQTQQIVYHLIRFFAKRELIQKDCPKEDEVLCAYHLKTLMLWTCEDMPPEWWISSSVIAICCIMLQKLSEWLNMGYCSNYFIPESNLFHHPSSSTMLNKVKTRLNQFNNSQTLCNWFLQNYILSFIVAYLKFQIPGQPMPPLENCMLGLTEFWRVSESETLNMLFLHTLASSRWNSHSVLQAGYGSGLRKNVREEDLMRRLGSYHTKSVLAKLPTIQNVSCFKFFDNLLYILYAAYGLDCGNISWDSNLFVEFLIGISIPKKAVKSHYHNFPKPKTLHSVCCTNHVSVSEAIRLSLDSRLQFLRAQGLMENLSGSNSRPEFQLLSLLSKEFLTNVCGALQLNCIAPAALAYLAALHFAKSEYQEAMHLCLGVLSYKITYMENETLNAGCLLFIDDVARIVGLCVLHKKIIDNDLHYVGRQLYLDLRLSPDLFAHYLIVLSSKQITSHRELPAAAFPLDDCLKYFLKSSCIPSNVHKQSIYRRSESLAVGLLSKRVTSVKETLSGLLLEYALENMTSFYNVIRRDFYLPGNIVECYRALYLYKCRKYSEVQRLCERILHETDPKSEAKGPTIANNILVLPPLDSFFDEDVQSLLGLHTLTYYLSPLSEPTLKYLNIVTTRQFLYWHEYRPSRPNKFCEDELCFLAVLQDVTECRNVLGGHFIARYLKVRCCIDCNLPYKEAMREFAAQAADCPFELIIRRFILQKYA